MARWLNWLERPVHTREVESSSLFLATMRKCRNWQTSKTKDLVIIAIVWVQVPSSALHICAFCGCSSMVEHQPSKLDTWVRFPSPASIGVWLSLARAPGLGPGGRRFESCHPDLIKYYAPLAHLVEHLTLNQGVRGSSPRWRTMQRYRSGHNEAVLKTVCPQGRVGSNPTLCV